MVNQYGSQLEGAITKRTNSFLYVGAGVVFLSAAAGMADFVRPLVTNYSVNSSVQVEQNSINSRVSSVDFEALNKLLVKKGKPQIWGGWKNE